MRIGIDCRFWGETGIGRYIRNVVFNLAEMDKGNSYILFLLSRDFDSIKLPNNFKKVKADIHWHTFTEQIFMPFIFLKENLDVLHIPQANYPILYPKKTVFTVHDLTPLRYMTGRVTTLPYVFYLVKNLGLRIALVVGLWRSKYVFTVTNYVKNDLIKTFNINPDKILITSCAVDDKFKMLVGVANSGVLKKYGITKPYLFYVGNAHPHKNLEKLVAAFEIISLKHPDSNLVLGGNKKFFYERLEKEFKQKYTSERINIPGFIDDADLPILYANAEAFVNPSLSEGFGIQVLEAYSCGTKVVCSNAGSLPEVGGDAAYYFDPTNVNNMAEVILTALDDSSDSIKRALGYEIVKKYDWKKTTETILNTYEKYNK